MSGQRVLVHGSGGGVGTFAVQLAYAAGAQVVADGATAFQAKQGHGLPGKSVWQVVADRDDPAWDRASRD